MWLKVIVIGLCGSIVLLLLGLVMLVGVLMMVSICC